MNTTTSKKDFFYIVVLILTFITVVVGATFAIYSLIFKQKEGANAVYTGTFSIEYLSGNIINCNLLKPMEELDLNNETNVYKNKFRVTNTGSLDSLVSVVLEIKKNEFSNETLMYSLYDETGLLISNFLTGKNELTLYKNIVLENGNSKDFILFIWLKENGENQNEEMKKNLVGQIRVDASQKID